MTVNFADDAAVPAAETTSKKGKAVGFLNYEIPADTPSGKAKFGAIALTREDHADYLDFILADPMKTDRRIQQLHRTTTVYYRSAEKKPRGFKLVDEQDEIDAATPVAATAKAKA